MVIRYSAEQSLLVITKGHPFDHGSFYEMLDAVLVPDGMLTPGGISWTHVEQPAASAMLAPDLIVNYDAILFYDMPGIYFRNPEAPEFIQPPEGLKENFGSLTQSGMPMFFLHHALAAWPAWREFSTIVGGRFHYVPDLETGRPDDGYRLDVQHFVRVVNDHPVTQGLGRGFEIEDETYLVSIDESDKLPLLRSGYEFTDDNFFSAELALSGNMQSRDGWSHPTGSNLIAWLKRSVNSPVLYFQCGDGPSAFRNAGFRQVVGNGVRWLLSGNARTWLDRM